MILAGKARAVLRGRSHVSIEDIQAVCPSVLRHRLIPNFAARSEGMTTEKMIARLLEEVPTDDKLYDWDASAA
jgi:MoxR-like ATPase